MNTDGVRAIVTAFFSLQTTLRRGAPARPGMASSPRLNTRISGLLIEGLALAIPKWEPTNGHFNGLRGFWGESSAWEEGGGKIAQLRLTPS